MIAIDSNLLIYAHQPEQREHAAAQLAIEKASGDPRGWGVPLPCIAEFWRAVTSTAHGRVPKPQQAQAFLDRLTQQGAAIWLPEDGFCQRLTSRAAESAVYGQRIFDLQIALIALENGATELWTHDQRFSTVPGLPVRDPLRKTMR